MGSLKLENTFNPYSERCAVHDRENAPRLRSETLGAMLEAAGGYDIDSIWIGRDLGYRGGRRTGLALTDDVHSDAHGARWGISVERPTKGRVVAERTAFIVWGILARVKAPIFLWNVFPLHPHEPDNPFTNRSHNPLERKAGEEFLAQLISLLRPSRLIAIGNDAELTAKHLSGQAKVIKVRHPSYGGQTRFLSQIADLYDLCEPRQGDEASHQLSLFQEHAES
uniref:Uracil DNA glycosylase superfamily protein n=1 Tax=Candidatus Kentrum sp. FW TaxID=2126338 RepID=A0A450SH98_9GAMM|nr:MAG: Uracil DNA glycosylase superfamily protein [Candidatus Kentron sp. FW]